MKFNDAISSAFRNFGNFYGTASRSEFWWYAAFYAIVYAGVWLLGTGALLIGGGIFTALGHLALIVLFIPLLSATIRRLREAGLHWAFAFFYLLPLIGWAVIAVLCALPANYATNRPVYPSYRR